MIGELDTGWQVEASAPAQERFRAPSKAAFNECLQLRIAHALKYIPIRRSSKDKTRL